MSRLTSWLRARSRGGPVVMLAATPFAGHQLYDQRLARALAQHGPVLYVSPPLAVVGPGGLSLPGTPPVDPTTGTALLTPLMLPYGRRRGLATVTGVLVGLQLLLRLARLRTLPSGLIVANAHPLTVAMLWWCPAVHVVLDDYVAGAALIGSTPERVSAEFRRSHARAEVVTVVSPALQQVVLRRGVRAEIVPAGCDAAPPVGPEPAVLAGVPPRRAVFIGFVSDRIDVAALRAVVDEGLEVVLVGGVQNTFTKHAELEALERTGHLHRVGSLGEDEVVAVLQHCDVGLVPYEATAFNTASFPLKTLEYLAAGLPVVASALPALAWLGCDHVHLARDAAELGKAAHRAEIDGHDPDVGRQCREFAALHTWSVRASTFRALLERA